MYIKRDGVNALFVKVEEKWGCEWGGVGVCVREGDGSGQIVILAKPHSKEKAFNKEEINLSSTIYCELTSHPNIL